MILFKADALGFGLSINADHMPNSNFASLDTIQLRNSFSVFNFVSYTNNDMPTSGWTIIRNSTSGLYKASQKIIIYITTLIQL